MSRERLVLIPSELMDNNSKKDRNENGLVRMSKAARENMGFENQVEVYPDTDEAEKRMKGSILLKIFHAFGEDIKKLAGNKKLTKEEFLRIGFVTTKTFRKVTDGSQAKQHKDIWIANDVNDTVIGADPEFLLFDDKGNVVRANNVLGYQGMLGCDGAMAEIRPKPAIAPETFIDNIRSIFEDQNLTAPIKPYDWRAGCYYKDSVRDYPIGGHLHIGNPSQIANLSLDKRERFFKIFNKIMDELLSIPMIKIDGTSLGKARRTECANGKYGYFGELRLCNGRLEHRTLSGLWLMHPKLSLCVIGTAKAIIDEVYRLVSHNSFGEEYMFPAALLSTPLWIPSFDRWHVSQLATDMGCVTPSGIMIELLHNSAATKIDKAYLKAWHNKMKKLSTYSVYAKHIDELYDILSHNTETFDKFDKSLQKNWIEKSEFIQ